MASDRRLVIGMRIKSDERWTGGSVYIHNLIHSLASLPPDERPEIRLLDAEENAAANAFRALPFVDPRPELRRKRSGIARVWGKIAGRYFQSLLPQDSIWRIDATYPSGRRSRGGAPIRWIPDFQHRHLPQLFRPHDLQALEAGFSEIAATSGVLVLSSHAARADFEAFYPGARAEVHVLRFCAVVDPDKTGAPDLGRYGLPRKYVYLPNQFWVHKNHMTAFKALVRLKDRMPDVTIVCTGLEDDYRDPDHMARLRAFIAENDLAGRVMMLGLLPRNEQMAVLRSAALVLQPSLFEGWSTAAEEAKAIGRPMLVSDLPVHREQFADELDPAACFFSPLKDEELADAIARLWPTLSPGPDAAAEARAAARNQVRRIEVGRTFVAIVARAIDLNRHL